MKVVSAQKMREIDRVTIEERGISGRELMERAGRAIAEGTAEFAEAGTAVLILCGKGNNGGDGFVAARYLAQSGREVILIPVFGTDGLGGDSRSAFDDMPPASITVRELPGRSEFPSFVEQFSTVLDAMLGTGATLPLRQPLDWVVQALNDSTVPVVSADIPTGLDADSGRADHAVRAALTVTIGLPKIGMLSPAGADVCGRVRVEAIQFPPDLLEDAAILESTMTASEAAALLPPRPSDSHKGTYGTLTICAGSNGMPGAALLAGTSALRSGVGLVRMHVPGGIRPHVATHLPEALLSTAGGESAPRLAPPMEDNFDGILQQPSAVVVGPGTTVNPGPTDFLKGLLKSFDGPTLIDADALGILAAHEEIAKLVHPRCVLTPHPGEMARLLGSTVAEIQRDRWQAAREAAEKFECPVVLKGCGTLVGVPGGRITHIPTGNTALARGGTGDLLAGMIGGLLAQGMAPESACCLGAFVCGMAADILIRDRSARGVLVREIAQTIPLAFRELETLTSTPRIGR